MTLELRQRFRLPNHENLVNSLTRHFGLRLILGNRQGREVRLIDRGQEKTYWRYSLIITSADATYDIYASKLARDPRATYLGRLFGSVDVPLISELIRQYDDARDQQQSTGSENPVSLLKRDRTGLVGRDEHPFVEALYTAIETFPQPHLDRRRQESGTGGATPLDEQTRRRNRSLGSLLGRLLQEEEVASFQGAVGNFLPLGLSIIPSSRRVEPMESGIFALS